MYINQYTIYIYVCVCVCRFSSDTCKYLHSNLAFNYWMFYLSDSHCSRRSNSFCNNGSPTVRTATRSKPRCKSIGNRVVSWKGVGNASPSPK